MPRTVNRTTVFGLGDEFTQVVTDKPLVRVETIRPAGIDLIDARTQTRPDLEGSRSKRASTMNRFTNYGTQVAITGILRKTIKVVILRSIAAFVVMLGAISSYADAAPWSV